MLPELRQSLREMRDQCSRFSCADIVVLVLIIIEFFALLDGIAESMR